MPRRRLLSSASDAVHRVSWAATAAQHGPAPVSAGTNAIASSTATSHVAGPSRFPGCLASSAPLTTDATGSVLERASAPLAFLYPPSCFRHTDPTLSSFAPSQLLLSSRSNVTVPSHRSYSSSATALATACSDPGESDHSGASSSTSASVRDSSRYTRHSAPSNSSQDHASRLAQAAVQAGKLTDPDFLNHFSNQLSSYLDSDTWDVAHASECCQHAARLVISNSRLTESIRKAKARDLYLGTCHALSHKMLARHASKLYCTMLEHLGSSESEADINIPAAVEAGPSYASSPGNTEPRRQIHQEYDPVHVAERLLSQLTMRTDERSPRPMRGFASEHDLSAALTLWRDMRRLGVPRSAFAQSALVRALVRSRLINQATLIFEAEVQDWWTRAKVVKAKRPEDHEPEQQQQFFDQALDPIRPSGQTFRDLIQGLAKFESALKDIDHKRREITSEHDRARLLQFRLDYAKSLLSLVQLLRLGRLPVPPSENKAEIAWVISACCRFQQRWVLDRLHASRTDSDHLMPHNDPAMVRTAKLIRETLCDFMRHLPSGQHDTDDLTGESRTQGQPGNVTFLPPRPPLELNSYNQLIHFSLAVLESPQMCKIVLEHMTAHRVPKLNPDATTFNIILRQATTKRFDSLARSVLIASQPKTLRSDKTGQPSPSKGKQVPVSTEAAGRMEGRSMLLQIDRAIRSADSHRLLALIQYVTSTGKFLRRYRGEMGHISVRELVFRLYPFLDVRHRFSKRVPPTETRILATGLTKSWHSPAALRSRVTYEQRLAILDPHVLTATLNLAAKAGRTGLALRIWRLIKRTSLQSLRPGQVSQKAWKIPLEAATVLMQVLARESRKQLKVLVDPRRHSRFARTKSRIRTQISSNRGFPRGWNTPSTTKLEAIGGRFVRQRFRVARDFAKQEYAVLMQRWRLFSLESIGMESEGKSRGLINAERLKHVASSDGAHAVIPDERFFDAVLDIFGRRAGMKARSYRSRGRSELRRRLRKSEQELELKRQLLSSAISLSDNSGSEDVIAARQARAKWSWNSTGRWTSLEPDAFLLTVLQDMDTLGLAIPYAFRWILLADKPDRQLPLPADVGVGRASAFRNLRIKEVGKVAQRRSTRVRDRRSKSE